MASRRLALTFARGAQAWTPQATSPVGVDPSATFNQPYDDLGATRDYSWTGPLPDIVLAPLSTVDFLVGYSAGPNAAITIGPTVVTLTQESVASIVAVPQVSPLFVPIPLDDLNPPP